MKLQVKRAIAVSMAMTMCIPAVAFAGQEGKFETSFDVYSPTLTVSVPVNADIEINPIADSNATGVKQFTVASNSIDIVNASVDSEADAGIPVNATIQATIASKTTDVITEYNTFNPDLTSTKKKIYLELTQAEVPATFALKSGETAEYTTEGKFNLEKFELTGAANYKTPAPNNKVSVTSYGSLLSVDVTKPSTGDTTNNSYADATKVTPTVVSFAVTGKANTNADWKADDIKIDITYNIKASETLAIRTPTVAPVTVTSGADLVITVPDVGESTILAVAIHNDEAEYGDYVLEDYEVEYETNAGTTNAKITLPANHVTLAFLADAANGCVGEAQDLIIGLSDGRRVVSTLTVSAPSGSNP